MQPTPEYSPIPALAITKHAAARMQQRGIDKLTVFLLREYGRKQYDGRSIIRYFDRKRAEQLVIRLRDLAHNIERVRTLYLVESDDTLVTVAYRTQHHKR